MSLLGLISGSHTPPPPKEDWNTGSFFDSAGKVLMQISILKGNLEKNRRALHKKLMEAIAANSNDNQGYCGEQALGRLENSKVWVEGLC